jgi:hypothetical protein
MKDMKSMKGGFILYPDVLRYSKDFHFVTQRRREISVMGGFFCSVAIFLMIEYLLTVTFFFTMNDMKSMKGCDIFAQSDSATHHF